MSRRRGCFVAMPSAPWKLFTDPTRSERRRRHASGGAADHRGARADRRVGNDTHLPLCHVFENGVAPGDLRSDRAPRASRAAPAPRPARAGGRDAGTVGGGGRRPAGCARDRPGPTASRVSSRRRRSAVTLLPYPGRGRVDTGRDRHPARLPPRRPGRRARAAVSVRCPTAAAFLVLVVGCGDDGGGGAAGPRGHDDEQRPKRASAANTSSTRPRAPRRRRAQSAAGRRTGRAAAEAAMRATVRIRSSPARSPSKRDLRGERGSPQTPRSRWRVVRPQRFWRHRALLRDRRERRASRHHRARRSERGRLGRTWRPARVPASAGSCVYFADFGDNGENRDDYRIHRVAEQASIDAGTHPIDFETLAFTYPDGSTTRDGSSSIRAPARSPSSRSEPADHGHLHSASTRLRQSGDVRRGGRDHLAWAGSSLADRWATYAPTARSSSGRTSTSTASRRRPSLGETLRGVPCTLPVAVEDQGEAVAWSANGNLVRHLERGHGREPACRELWRLILPSPTRRVGSARSSPTTRRRW